MDSATNETSYCYFNYILGLVESDSIHCNTYSGGCTLSPATGNLFSVVSNGVTFTSNSQCKNWYRCVIYCCNSCFYGNSWIIKYKQRVNNIYSYTIFTNRQQINNTFTFVYFRIKLNQLSGTYYRSFGCTFYFDVPQYNGYLYSISHSSTSTG